MDSVRLLSRLWLFPFACLVMGLWGASAAALDVDQIKLTEDHIAKFISAQKDIRALVPRLQSAADKPDDTLKADLDAVAVKHGFKDFTDLDVVAANITLILSGFEPESDKFIEPVKALEDELKAVQADDSIPASEKKQLVADINEALKETKPVQFTENIELVRKNREAIEKSLE